MASTFELTCFYPKMTILYVAEKETERKRVRRWWDLQQRLTVRNSVVYINCNLFHSLSGLQSRMCVCKNETVSAYTHVRMCVSPRVYTRVCARACALTCGLPACMHILRKYVCERGL